jgi:tRNA pseudouridine38-40 synthase
MFPEKHRCEKSCYKSAEIVKERGSERQAIVSMDRARKNSSNWKLTLAYDGTDFYGWQIQPDRATIQGTLAEAIEHVTSERVLPQGSGRTDAGVHARGQAASFFLHAAIPASNFLRALNRRLPEAIRVLQAEPAAAEFHARHSAKAKTYEYRIDRGEICPPWTARYAWALHWPLDLERMRDAAARVMGTHDFTSFAASDPDQATRREEEDDAGAEAADNVRTILESGWREDGELLIYRVRGSGFLHHMVRNLVGTFVDVGRGQLEPDAIARILQARSRGEAGATAPARGLFLDHVEY